MQRSSVNTNEEPPHNLPAIKAGSLAKVPDPSPVDIQVADLQNRLSAEEDRRKEERWFWLSGCAVLVDIIAFREINALGASLIFVLELTMLTLLARRWGVEDVLKVMSEVVKLVKSVKGDKDDDD